jgi:hypothetical protein
MSACRLDRSGGDGQRRLSQNCQHIGGRDTANASALQDPGDAHLTDALRLVGRRHELPQIKEPFGAQVLFELEHGGKIAPQLLVKSSSSPKIRDVVLQFKPLVTRAVVRSSSRSRVDRDQQGAVVQDAVAGYRLIKLVAAMPTRTILSIFGSLTREHGGIYSRAP